MSTIVDSRPRGSYIPVDCPAYVYVNLKGEELMKDVNRIRSIWSHPHLSEPSESDAERKSSLIRLCVFSNGGKEKRNEEGLMKDVNNSSIIPNPALQLPPRHLIMQNHRNHNLKQEEGGLGVIRIHWIWLIMMYLD